MVALVEFLLLTMAAVMTAGWLVQRAARDGGWIDVFWTFGTGLCAVVAALVPLGDRPAPTWRQIAVAALMVAWSLRLGSHIVRRVAKPGEDARYAALRLEWGSAFQPRMFLLALFQAPASAVLGLAVALTARRPDLHLRPSDAVAAAVALAALVGEAAADGQLARFRADHPAGALCDRGLWAWSRHPNYVFEFLFWMALPIAAVVPGRPWTLVSLAGPALMFALLRYGSGVPPLERRMAASRGEAWRRYAARTPIFLPWPRPSPAGPSSKGLRA